MQKHLLTIFFLLVLTPVSFAKVVKGKKHNEITSVSIHRTACFGHCPDYEVKVENTGLVTYTGHMFVQDSGTFQKKVKAADVKNIFNLCLNYKVDTCQDVYNNIVPDLPGLYMVVTYTGKTKKITNASFGPGFLREIANSIDAVGRVDSTWKKVPFKPVTNKNRKSPK